MIVGFDADQDCSHVAQAAHTKGVAFVMRYLKNVSAKEIAALQGAGLAVGFIWELWADRALAGTAGGTQDGKAALKQLAGFAVPNGVCVFTTVDFDSQANQDDTVLDYLAAFKAALGGKYKLGVYANGALCDLAKTQGIVDLTWLAGGNGMRGSAAYRASGKASIMQDVGDARHLGLGISLDSDVALVPDYGAWLPPNAPAPPASTVEADMAAAIKRVQQLLADQALYHSTIDGIAGPETIAALEAWESAG